MKEYACPRSNIFAVRRKYLPSVRTAQSHRIGELSVLLSDAYASRIFENAILNSVSIDLSKRGTKL
jgi:hypothetical protein